VTWTEDDLCSIDLYPVLDRIHYEDILSVVNDGPFSAGDPFTISDTDARAYYPDRTKTWALNYFRPEDAGGIWDQTTTIIKLHRPFTGISQPMGDPPFPWPASIHQLRVSVPYGVGLPIELGDIVAIPCAQLGMTTPWPWRVEQISGPGAAMEFEFLMHDAL